MKKYLLVIVFLCPLIAFSDDQNIDINKFYHEYDIIHIRKNTPPISVQEHQDLMLRVELGEINESLEIYLDHSYYSILFNIDRVNQSIYLNGFNVSIDDSYSYYSPYGNNPNRSERATFWTHHDRGMITASCQSSRANEAIVIALIFYTKWPHPPCLGSCIYFNSRVLEVTPRGVSRINGVLSVEEPYPGFYISGGLEAGFTYYDYDYNFNGQFERDWEQNLMPNDTQTLERLFQFFGHYPYFSEERILEGMRARGWCASENFDLQVLEQEYADYDSERRRDIGFFNMVLSELPLNKSRVTSYNNIAYYLEQSKHYDSAIYLLDKIVERFPDRTVAYINLGDAHWGAEHPELAREAYQTYIRLMRENNREQRIPQRVFERVGE